MNYTWLYLTFSHNQRKERKKSKKWEKLKGNKSWVWPFLAFLGPFGTLFGDFYIPNAYWLSWFGVVGNTQGLEGDHPPPIPIPGFFQPPQNQLSQYALSTSWFIFLVTFQLLAFQQFRFLSHSWNPMKKKGENHIATRNTWKHMKQNKKQAVQQHL